MMRTAMVALLLAGLAGLAAGRDAAAAGGCRDELGPARATVLVEQCLAVSPATRPPCNAANGCGMIRDEIKRGCILLDRAKPGFCDGYLAGAPFVEPPKASVAPSFDCAKAASPAEKAICADDELAGLDRRLAEAYGARQRAGGDATALRDAQRAFLRDRDRCPAAEPGRSPEEMRRITTSCLAGLMRARTEELTGRAPAWSPLSDGAAGERTCTVRFGHDGSDAVELAHGPGRAGLRLRFVELSIRLPPMLHAGDGAAFDIDGRSFAARAVPPARPDDDAAVETAPTPELLTALAGGQLLRVLRNGKPVFRAPLATLGAADAEARRACGVRG